MKKTRHYTITIFIFMLVVGLVWVNYFDGQVREAGSYLLGICIAGAITIFIPHNTIYSAFSRRY